MRYGFIRQEIKNHSVNQLCGAMLVSRSGYYEWSQRQISRRQQEEDRLKQLIKQIFDESRQIYGYRQIQKALSERGESCGKHQVISLMKKLQLRAISRRKFRVITTDSRHNKPVHSNALNREFNPNQMNQS